MFNTYVGRSSEDIALSAIMNLNLNSANTKAQVISAGTVSSNYFRLLGMKPELERFFERYYSL
jgi:hypothetical protein